MEKRDLIKKKIDYLKKTNLPSNSEDSDDLIRMAGHTGDYNITRLFLNRQYPATNTKFEILELDRHLISLISARQFSWDFLREYFEKIGYPASLVRKRFKALTGIDPEEYYYKIYESAVVNVPKEIPAANLGWGKSKDKNYDYYFVNPGVYEYAIYGQKGELQRDLIREYPSVSLALKDLENKVEQVFTLDKPVDLKIIDKTPSLSEPFRTYAQEVDTNVTEELREIAPTEFFESELRNLKEKQVNVGDVIQDITNYIEEKDSAFSEFGIRIKSFKYKAEEIEEILEQIVPETESTEEQKFFNKEAVVSVLLEIEYQPTNDIKYGLMVFTIKDDEIFTNDTFKGEDNKIYALTSEGLNNYFKDIIEKKSYLLIFD